MSREVRPRGGGRMPTVAYSRIVDLSQEISRETQMFPAYPVPTSLPWTTLEVHHFDAEVLFLASHTGTHMDAPNHVVRGRRSIDRVPLGPCLTRARILDLRPPRARERITGLRLRRALDRAAFRRGEAAILRTGWEARRGRAAYLEANPGVTEDGARELLRWRPSLVGIDTANLDAPSAPTLPAHRVLLDADVPVIENLANLASVRADAFTLVALPLRFAGATGSPVRAVALVGPTSPRNPRRPLPRAGGPG